MKIPDELEYGPVVIADGPFKGRIGYYDNDESVKVGSSKKETYQPHAVVYFGTPLIARGFYFIPFDQIRAVTTHDLLSRRDELARKCYLTPHEKQGKKYIEDLLELHYVESEVVERLIRARHKQVGKGVKVFISHSSIDKGFARQISTDLSAFGHDPWLDEWQIKVGESIPEKIATGLEDADYILVVLSSGSVASKWVEREWHAKYWDEVSSGRVTVLPMLLSDCTIPTLLKTKKYADFRSSYNDGLDDILAALQSGEAA